MNTQSTAETKANGLPAEQEKKSGSTNNSEPSKRVKFYSSVGTLAFSLLAAAVAISFASSPVAAANATNGSVDICSTSFLPGMANAIIQLCIYGGGIGFLVTWQGTNLVETLPVGKETKKKLRSYRSSSMSAFLKVLLAGPILLLIVNFANIPWASCIDPVPF